MALSNDELQFSSLYVMRFAGSFGFMSVMTLLPDFIEALGATGITIGVFFLGGAAALSGVATFGGILAFRHGREGLRPA